MLWCAITFVIVPLMICCSVLWLELSMTSRRARAICCCVNDTGSVSSSSTTGSGTTMRGGELAGGGGGGGSLGACFELFVLDRFLSSFAITLRSETRETLLSLKKISLQWETYQSKSNQRNLPVTSARLFRRICRESEGNQYDKQHFDSVTTHLRRGLPSIPRGDHAAR